ncbi:MAG: SDR family oxidoreductase [Actinomycetota bacterium]
MARPLVLLTGLGRPVGIAAAIAERLATDGWDIAFVYSGQYDADINGGAGDIPAIEQRLRSLGAQTVAIEADLGHADVASSVFERAETLGPVAALVLSHAHSTNAGILTETVESFDRHFAVNTRGSWLLVREYGRRFEHDSGRIVALTSDAIHHEIAYGASKAALDRIIFAAAREFGARRITANLVNPGPIDTGWMTDEVRAELLALTPFGRLGVPADAASLVAFLLSADGGWITGQLIKSDGGFGAP